MTIRDYVQTQPLFRVALALVAGIVVGDKVAFCLPLFIWIIASILCLIILFIAGKRHACLQSSMVFLSTFFIGVALMTRVDRESVFPFEENNTVHYDAVIANEPKVRGRTLLCDLILTKVGEKAADSRTLKVRAAILRDTLANDWKGLHAGSGIKAMSIMQPLQDDGGEGNFSYSRWLWTHDYCAQTYIYYSDWQKERLDMTMLPQTERLRLKALWLRARMMKRFFPSAFDDQQQAIVAAMTLGDKKAVDGNTKDVYSLSGASHVLALSGLHLGIIYAVLMLLLGGRRQHSLWRQMLVLLAIWSYVVIVGMGASVVRAALMLTVYSICIVSRRDKASANALAFAAMCLLVVNPRNLWDVGFQMSFMAVLAIIVYYQWLYDLLPLTNKLLKVLWGMAVVSITAQLGTAPLVAYYFGRFSCYFLLTNFIVVPMATVIIYGALLLFASCPLPLISRVVAKALYALVGWLNAALAWIASLPGASIENINLSLWQLTLIYTLIAVVSLSVAYISRVRKVSKMDAFINQTELEQGITAQDIADKS